MTLCPNWRGGADCLQDSFGFSFVSDVPVSTEATEQLAERIGFIRETQCASALHFDLTSVLTNFLADGKFWEFTSDLSKGDTAYTTMALGPHTDNTYFVRPSPPSFLASQPT